MSERPDIPWIPAEKNPWKVPVLDVRPLTTTYLSTSKDQTCAANAVSYGQDDGTGFIPQVPDSARVVRASLSYPRDRLFADGALFLPREMENKWALYHHRGRILFIRSWQRRVLADATVVQEGTTVSLTEIRGSIADEREEPRLTVRFADFLIRTHVLGLPWPVPLPEGLERDPESAALWCFSTFGNFAHFATPHTPFDPGVPIPLRSHSMLHIAVARGDAAAARACLRAGVPIDLLATDGLPPMQWALGAEGTAMLRFLREEGGDIDVRSEQGATPLMTATQGDRDDILRWLLSNGADVNARDARGFTALHRAAEMGKLAFVEALLAAGADRSIEAESHTALSLAELRGQTLVAKRLR